MKRASTISNIDCVMPQVNSRWRCSNRCEAAKRWVEYPDHIFVDRIDLQVEVAPLSFEEMSRQEAGESSATIRARVVKARQVQQQRFHACRHVHNNAQMTPRLMQRHAQPDAEGLEMLRQAMNRLQLSARAYDRILRVARTIADLDGAEQIRSYHLAEAIGYRNLDRSSWGQ